MRRLHFTKNLGIISFALLFLDVTANSQPLLLRSTLGTGGASITISTGGNKISFPQSIGQYGVTGSFSMKNLEIRQGFIQPVLIVKSFNETVNNNFIVYPNPFSSVIFVKVNKEVTGNIELKIMDLAGKPVHIETITAETIIQVNLSSLKRGLYVLSIRGKNIQTNNKIIKN